MTRQQELIKDGWIYEKNREREKCWERGARRDHNLWWTLRRSERNDPRRHWGDIWWDRYWEEKRGLEDADRSNLQRLVATQWYFNKAWIIVLLSGAFPTKLILVFTNMPCSMNALINLVLVLVTVVPDTGEIHIKRLVIFSPVDLVSTEQAVCHVGGARGYLQISPPSCSFLRHTVVVICFTWNNIVCVQQGICDSAACLGLSVSHGPAPSSVFIYLAPKTLLCRQLCLNKQVKLRVKLNTVLVQSSWGS